ncbi:MAG: REP-associated tyrosine transposase [Fimbriimonadaceae bacterium]|jgi:REP element-mobilizing transposase RayT|nr:REP-associated tyrosine transposase [Fimbriimonadaceae bacterium]
MARYRHYQNRGGPGHTIYATTTVLDFAHVLRRPEMKDRMVHLIYRTHQRYRAKLHSYVVMNNHVHLISTMPEDRGSTWFMQRLKDQSTNNLLPLLLPEERSMLSVQAGLDRRQLWMRSFDSVVLEQPMIFTQKLNYIHQNPVRAGLVAMPDEYRWSSAAAFARGEWTPDMGLPLRP